MRQFIASFDPTVVNGLGVFPEPVEVVEGDPSAIGAVRKVPIAPGKFIFERLVALDSVNNSQTYELVVERTEKDVLPVTINALRGTLSVEPITLSNQSLFRWKIAVTVAADAVAATTAAVPTMQTETAGAVVAAFKKSS